MHALESRGIEIGLEFIIVYNRELNTGDNSLEILFGGGPAWAVGAALGFTSPQIGAMLQQVGLNAGLLVGATVDLNFGGDFGSIHFSLDAYAGGDMFAFGAGRWQLLWSQDKTEIGETGYWAAIAVTSGAVCQAGLVFFASDPAIRVLWDLLTTGTASPPLPPVCGLPSSGSSACDSCLAAGCCAQADTCTHTSGCSTLFQCHEGCAGGWACTVGCNTSADTLANASVAPLEACMRGCFSACASPVVPFVAPM